MMFIFPNLTQSTQLGIETSNQLVASFKLDKNQGRFALPTFSLKGSPIQETCPSPPSSCERYNASWENHLCYEHIILKGGVPKVPHTGRYVQQLRANLLGELKYSFAEATASRIWGRCGATSNLWPAISKGSFCCLNISPEQVSTLLVHAGPPLVFEWRHCGFLQDCFTIAN